VEPSCVARKEVLTSVAKFALDMRLVRFAVLTTDVQTIVDK